MLNLFICEFMYLCALSTEKASEGLLSIFSNDDDEDEKEYMGDDPSPSLDGLRSR